MQVVSVSPQSSHSRLSTSAREGLDGPHRAHLPVPQPTRDSTAQDVYERANVKTSATPVYDNTPRHRIAEAVRRITEMAIPHWVPGVLLRPARLLLDAAERLVDAPQARWEEALQPLDGPLFLRQDLFQRFRNYFRRDDCREALNQQQQVTVHLVALEQWCSALLCKAADDGLNVTNKLLGLRATLQRVEEVINNSLQGVWSRHTVKLEGVYAPRLRRRIEALETALG